MIFCVLPSNRIIWLLHKGLSTYVPSSAAYFLTFVLYILWWEKRMLRKIMIFFWERNWFSKKGHKIITKYSPEVQKKCKIQIKLSVFDDFGIIRYFDALTIRPWVFRFELADEQKLSRYKFNSNTILLKEMKIQSLKSQIHVCKDYKIISALNKSKTKIHASSHLPFQVDTLC